MKIAGISGWIWAVGCLVIAGGSVVAFDLIKVAPSSVHNAQSPPKPDTGKVVVSKLREIEKSAADCLKLGQSLIGKEYDVSVAEEALESQRSAGGAQLKAIDLNDAKEALKKADAAFGESLKGLKEKEDDFKKNGGTASNLGRKSYVASISDFRWKGYRAVSSLKIEIHYKGWTEKAKTLSDLLLKFRFTSTLQDFEDLPSGE